MIEIIKLMKVLFNHSSVLTGRLEMLGLQGKKPVVNVWKYLQGKMYNNEHKNTKSLLVPVVTSAMRISYAFRP